MRLYYDPITVNCRKVVAGLDLIGASYDEERLDYFAGDHKQSAFTEINPNAELPAQGLPYITVENLEASAARCEALGGRVLAGPKSAGGQGRYCVIQDPAGAVAALYVAG